MSKRRTDQILNLLSRNEEAIQIARTLEHQLRANTPPPDGVPAESLYTLRDLRRIIRAADLLIGEVENPTNTVDPIEEFHKNLPRTV